MGRSYNMYVIMASAYKILVGKPEGKNPLGKFRHSWDNNIKMDLN
jgi:hypothetical protein